MRRITLIALTTLALTACTDAPTAERVLRQNGYTDIQITGYDAFMCGQSDTFSTGFTARSVGGQRVSGAVCSAAFKGATIRFK
ncbi:hypothetical protein FV222_00380 [Methylobacterium sp. WL103]|uniref:hypothetical protein n=1 Tax=Methylobacterium sp. WL103 TaxID=2603891 RepID=UPI0011C8B27C|nr:hypothetical protein [Methylobacterium sp. WL103]TXN08961.1 hypothetical protein FV222_00380 [Methylobacterium sp. WL103]